jgi:hypothetical protein
VQERYFVPILPLVAIMVGALVNRAPDERLSAATAISAAVLSGSASIEAILRTDWNAILRRCPLCPRKQTLLGVIGMVRLVPTTDIQPIFAFAMSVSSRTARNLATPPTPNIDSDPDRAWAIASTKRLPPNEPHVRAAASGAKQNHFIWFGIAAFHTRRTDRHAWNGKACRIRFLGQEVL